MSSQALRIYVKSAVPSNEDGVPTAMNINSTSLNAVDLLAVKVK